MTQQFKVAVFDLDGTILDTSEGVLASIRYTIEKHQLKMLEDDVLRTFIGPPIQNSLEKYFGIHGEELRQITETFRNRYKNVDLLKAKPYEGIYEVFSELIEKGIKPVIATYKRQDYATRLLKHFEFDQYTDIMYGADNENKLKKKDIITKAILECGLSDFSEAVMIGDSENDAIGAADIGAGFIGVTYGFGFKSGEDVGKFSSLGNVATPREITKLFFIS